MALTEKGQKLWDELYKKENKESCRRMKEIVFNIRKEKCKG